MCLEESLFLPGCGHVILIPFIREHCECWHSGSELAVMAFGQIFGKVCKGMAQLPPSHCAALAYSERDSVLNREMFGTVEVCAFISSREPHKATWASYQAAMFQPCRMREGELNSGLHPEGQSMPKAEDQSNGSAKKRPKTKSPWRLDPLTLVLSALSPPVRLQSHVWITI